MTKRLRVKVDERWYTVQIGDLDSNPVRVLVDGEPVDVDIERIGRTETSPALTTGDDAPADAQQATEPSQTPTPRPAAAVRTFRSPMPGVILSVAVEKGQQVVTGDEVCVLEAMKMQQSLRADWSGVVQTVHVKPGQQVLDGDPILELG